MGQFSTITIVNAHTVSQRALDCRPGIDGLNQVYGPNHHFPSVQSICGKYINLFTRCTIKNQHDILYMFLSDIFDIMDEHNTYQGGNTTSNIRQNLLSYLKFPPFLTMATVYSKVCCIWPNSQFYVFNGSCNFKMFSFLFNFADNTDSKLL